MINIATEYIENHGLRSSQTLIALFLMSLLYHQHQLMLSAFHTVCEFIISLFQTSFDLTVGKTKTFYI